MLLRVFRAALAAMTVFALVLMVDRSADAGDPRAPGYKGKVTAGNDLFYNYYIDSSQVGGVPAGMYPAPLPTPPLVGHTYVTYQPFMPHEYMYKHHRTYHRYHPGGGYTRTLAIWNGTPLQDLWHFPYLSRFR